MIKAIIIEDEPRNVVLLQTLLQTHCTNSIQLAGHAGDLEPAYELIIKTEPQLVFLDIELNGGNAFQLLEKVQTAVGIHFEIIFITAFNEYAVKAFRQNAVDYILKPISTPELKLAIAKAVKKIAGNEANQNIVSLLKELKQQPRNTKIGLPVKDTVLFVPLEDIVRVEAKGNHTVVYMVNNRNITCSKTMGDMEDFLPGPQFIRVHNSWIINTRFLKIYYRGKNGYIQMDDDAVVPVSIRKKGDFLDMIDA